MATGWRKDYFRYKDYFLNVLRVYKSKPNFRAFLEIILTLTTIIIFSVFAIRPTIITITELNKEISTKKETLQTLKTKLTNLQKATEILKIELGRLPLILQSVPKSANPEGLIQQLEYQSQLSGVNVLGISVSEVTLAGEEEVKKRTREYEALPQNAGELPITISLTGTYQGLLSFLEGIEEARRPIKVDSFAFNANITEGGKILVMIISGRSPFYSKK